MTLGVGVQGDGWAVIGADSLVRNLGTDGLGARVLRRKIQQWSPTTYVMWAGRGLPDDYQPSLTLSDDPEQCAEEIHLHIRFALARNGKEPQVRAIVLTGKSPRVFRVTETETIEAKPGKILDTNGLAGSYSVPGSESAGRKMALRWLSQWLQVPGQRGEYVDYPLVVVSRGPSGVVEEAVETEADLPTDLPTLGV